MANKQYLNAFINNSATIREQLATDITDASHRADAYESSGKLVLPAADGEAALGILLSDTNADNGGITKAGTEVDVLIKNIGLVLAAGAVKKGDHLTATAMGAVQKAAVGNYILGIAMSNAAAAGELVQIQLTKGGYEKAEASSGGGSN